MDSTEITQTDPLPLPDDPDTITDIPPELPTAIAATLYPETDDDNHQWGPATDSVLQHLLYIAATSDETHTPADLAAIVADADRCNTFCDQLDADAADANSQFFTADGDLKPHFRKWVADCLAPARDASE